VSANDELRERIAWALIEDHESQGFSTGFVERGECYRMADALISCLGLEQVGWWWDDAVGFVPAGSPLASAGKDRLPVYRLGAPGDET
jgi:hypothetical protein